MVSPNSSWMYPAPAGFTNMLFKEKEITIPKWSGETSGWHNFHTRLEVSLADLNKSYLLAETGTTPHNASDSKLLARAFWSKLGGDALLPFSSQTDQFLNKGLEMYQELQAIYAPVDEPTLLSPSKSLTNIRMQQKESILSFVNRIRTLNKDLTLNGQPWNESHLTLLGIQGLDTRRYNDLIKSSMTGTHSASNLSKLIIIVTNYKYKYNS